MYLDLNKSVGPVTGKWCIRKNWVAWDVFDGFGVWWGIFETFDKARDYVTDFEARWSEWMDLL